MCKWLMNVMTKDSTNISYLRMLAGFGFHGRAHQWADHFYTHCTDHTNENKLDFYREHGYDRSKPWITLWI